jgi:hypothetical protein
MRSVPWKKNGICYTYISVFILAIFFEEEGIICGYVSESGYIVFLMWKKCGG